MAKYDAAPTLAAGLIRLARQKAELTQSELAIRAGLSQQAVSAYETGRKEPTLPTLERLIDAAGLEMRIHLAPRSDHDASIDEFLAGLPVTVRSEIELDRREGAASARIRRIRNK